VKQQNAAPLVGILMGSKSDWEVMRLASETLTQLEIANECRVISAHRAPDALFEYVGQAESRGLKVIIAGAGGAAHLPGVIAAKTTLPVLGCPMQSKALQGMDSLLSIVQMPKGIPVAALAIGEAGAANAGLFAAAILALSDSGIKQRLEDYRRKQTEKVLADTVLTP
jgi:5-(carboxyamino)imidazole ribonucleotide mutase